MRTGLIVVLMLVNLLSFVISNVSFKWSAMSLDTGSFLRWQILGNITGFINVLSLTGLLKYIPMHYATAMAVGLGFVLVQVIGAHFIFHEAISRFGWTGTGLIMVGIVFVSLGQPR